MIREKDVFTYHKTSQLKTIVIVFSILIVIEGVILHFVIQFWSNVAAWMMTILNIYALLYMVGLYNSARFLPHVLTQDKLIIRHGYQSNIEFNITNIERLREARQKGVEDKVPKETYYSLLHIDSPQFELFLKEPALMKGAYGRKKYVKTVVF